MNVRELRVQLAVGRVPPEAPVRLFVGRGSCEITRIILIDGVIYLDYNEVPAHGEVKVLWSKP